MRFLVSFRISCIINALIAGNSLEEMWQSIVSIAVERWIDPKGV